MFFEFVYIKKYGRNFDEMKKLDFDVVLFDLDGTLTDSVDGIINAVKYACEKIGVRQPDKEELIEFIGPPMTESFASHFGLTGQKLDEAIKQYHIYYAERVCIENKVFDGIDSALKCLKDKGKTLGLCTNKSEIYAKEIMDFFGLSKYMDFVGGSSYEENRTVKWQVIDYVIKNLNVSDLKKAVMVGDRHYDVEGANAVGIKTIGVTFGYGTRDELEKAGAMTVVDTPKEICELF